MELPLAATLLTHSLAMRKPAFSDFVTTPEALRRFVVNRPQIRLCSNTFVFTLY